MNDWQAPGSLPVQDVNHLVVIQDNIDHAVACLVCLVVTLATGKMVLLQKLSYSVGVNWS